MLNKRNKFISWSFKLLVGITLCSYIFISHAPVHDFYWDVKQEQQVELSQKELNCLATNIYHEARGEPWSGQVLVARVTLNRVASPLYPNTVCGVVYQPSQFSWTLQGNLPIKDKNAFILAKAAAKAAKWYNSPATHFHTITVSPSWRHKFTKLETINNHIFYHHEHL